MIPTGPFWMICYRGHQICRTEFERTDNQGCRKAALNFSRYSLLSVYVFSSDTPLRFAIDATFVSDSPNPSAELAVSKSILLIVSEILLA